jgi:hypothetical protein
MLLDAYNHASRHSSATTSTARLISPELPASHGYCILFWYNLHGADVKELNVYAKVWDMYSMYFDILKVNFKRYRCNTIVHLVHITCLLFATYNILTVACILFNALFENFSLTSM